MQNHAVVIGAGMSGLSAARVLERFFEKITVLDRDELPEGSTARAGVPQARHVHALVTRGAQELDALFPGFLAEYEAKGAHASDQGDRSRSRRSARERASRTRGSGRRISRARASAVRAWRSKSRIRIDLAVRGIIAA